MKQREQATRALIHMHTHIVHEREKQNTSKNVILFLDADHLRREM